MAILQDKVAIVTGAAMGIGRAVALLYAKEGAKVVVSDINEKAGNLVVKEIKEMGAQALFIKADTSNSHDQEFLVNSTIVEYGQLDIACNNAGIAGLLYPVAEYPVEGWDKVISINLSGVFYGMHYQIPAMLAGRGGCIINISSILGQVATKNSAAYVAAKHGVVGLTKAAALEYAHKNIRVNAVGPGYIKTPLLSSLDETTLKEIVTLHPMGRLGEASEVAEVVLWLSSSTSSFVTGSYYPVDGGYLAQ